MRSQELMRSRYDATPLPVPTSNTADDAEKIVQWFLECAFFKPFVYRNPMKDPQKEFADALIIFDDTIVIVQVKAKSSERAETDWIAKHATKASRQLNGSFRQLKDGIIKSFTNPVFMVKKEIDFSKYPYVYGVIILACVNETIDPLALIDSADRPALPTAFLSISDLRILTERVNAAADFIHYCEAHTTLASRESVPINQENTTLERIAAQVPELLSEGRPIESFSEKHLLGFQWISRLFKGEVNLDPDYRYSLLVDDILSHSHDLDPEHSAPFTEASSASLKIAEQLGWLDRKRRIELGKLLYRFADAARDGNTRLLPYMRLKLGVLILFMYTRESRVVRRVQLHAFVGLAQVKYGVTHVLGIATEPIGDGRSYDMVWVDDLLVSPSVEIPIDVLAALPDLECSLFEE